MRRFGILLGLLLALTLTGAVEACAEVRLALVIGEANYKVAPLATPANDAGLVAATLREAGFAVTEGADLNGAGLRQALHDFVAKVEQAGPGSIVFVYLAGRGMQFAGQNYVLPVDAFVQREADVPVVAVRLADYFGKLIAVPAKARIFVLDGARILHFATEGAPFASGFGLETLAPGTVYAFNEAPGAVSPDEPGPYGIYAQALVEMLRQGFAIPDVFIATRLRANDLSDGIIVPWDAAQLAPPIALFARAKNAPPLPPLAETGTIRGLPVAKAYLAAVEADRLDVYAAFCAAFPNDPLTLRVRALLAVRREALTWQSAVAAGTPQAIWTYMRRYPRGPHFPDARRRLEGLAAPLDPPPRFDPYDFKALVAPSEAELDTLDQPVMTFDDPAFPPPPSALDRLPERPVEFEHLLPPVPGGAGLLPVPAAMTLSFSKPILPAGGASTAPVASVAPPPEPAAKLIGVPPLPQPVIAAPALAENTAVPLPPKRPAKAKPAAKHQKSKKSPPHAKHGKAKAAPHPKHGRSHPAPAKAKPHAKKKHRR
jgi:uncharacterized caspase-like protein